MFAKNKLGFARNSGFTFWELGPTPLWSRYSLRFVVGYACACGEGGIAMGFARGNGERVCEGNGERVLGVHGVIHSRKAIRTDRETNRQKAMRSPFPCRKGGRGDRSSEKDRHSGLSLRIVAKKKNKDGPGERSYEGIVREGVWVSIGVTHSRKAIRTARETNLQNSHALPLVSWKKGLI